MPVVHHGDGGVFGSGGSGDVDAPVGRGVLNGVVEQVLQDVFQQFGVTAHGGQAGRDFYIQGD